MSEDQEIRHADPKEGFDPAEPQVNAIAFFGIGSVILLVVMILALQSYFYKIWDEAVYQKILAPPSEELIHLHQREDWNLTHYGYFDKASGAVRIPISQAMETFAQEAAAGKLFYPAKATSPEKDVVPPAPAPGAAPVPGGAPGQAPPPAGQAAGQPMGQTPGQPAGQAPAGK
jgi:hypothetical protein